jgi:hypothetical protein
MSREDYCIAQAAQLGRTHYRRTAAVASRHNTEAPHRTIFQKFVEMQVYSQYVFVLRRIDPITNAIVVKKEKQMGGASSEQSKQWQKGECAYNRLVYAEQMRWSSLAPWPTSWVALPGLSCGSSKSALSSSGSLLTPVPDCVPGFVPPPGWRLSYEQFCGLQSHGIIPEDQAWTGVMPMPRKHNTASEYLDAGLAATRGGRGGIGSMFQDERMSFLHIPADGERTVHESTHRINNNGNRANNRTYSHGSIVQHASMRYSAHVFSPTPPPNSAPGLASNSTAQSTPMPAVYPSIRDKAVITIRNSGSGSPSNHQRSIVPANSEGQQSAGRVIDCRPTSDARSANNKVAMHRMQTTAVEDHSSSEGEDNASK